MPQLATLWRSKYPGSYDDMDDTALEKAILDKHPEYKDLTEEKPSILKKAYEKATTPLTTKPREVADWLADKIDPRLSDEHNPIRSFLAGSVQGVGDVLTSMTSPLDLAATVSGVGAIKKGSQGLRRLTQVLSAPIALHGGSEVIRPDATLGERGMGLAELAGGAAGMYFPESALTAGPRFHAGTSGETIDINTTPLRRSTEVPYRAPDSLDRSDVSLFDAFRTNARMQNRREKFAPVPLEKSSDQIELEAEMMYGIRQGEIGYGNSETPPTRYEINEVDDGLAVIDTVKNKILFRTDNPNEAREFIKPLLRSEQPILDAGDPYNLRQLKEDVYNDALAEGNRVAAGMEAKFPNIRENTFDTAALKVEDVATDIPPNLQGVVEMQGGLGGAKPPKPVSKPRPGPTGAVVDKLLSNMEVAKGLREEQEAIYRKGRAARFAAFESVGTTGMAGAKKSLGKLKGEFEKVENDALNMKPQEVDTLFNAVKTANITTGEKARGFTALLKILDGGSVPQRGELRILDDVFGGGFSEKIIEMHGGLGATGLKMAKTANTMKAMMSSVDASGPLRQGLGLIHRKEWRGAFGEMFKYMANKEHFETAMAEIKKRPEYLLGREAGLFIAEPKDLLKSEEAFANSYVHSFPLIRDVVEASERGYTGFLNKLRADTFKSLLDQSKLMGHEAFTIAEIKLDDGTVKRTIVPSKVADNIAKYINVSTGRGGLGRLEKMAPELNTILWSPRLISSRLTILNPKYYMDMDPFTRKEAVKSLFAIAAAGMTMSTLGVLAGGKSRGNPVSDENIDWNDPRSSDFGKVRFGNKVFDPWGGFQQPIVAAARLLSGRNEISPQNRFQTLDRFAQNKLSPFAGLINDLLRAKEFTGTFNNPSGEYIDQYNNKKDVRTEVAKRFIPIFIQDVTETIQEDPSFAEAVGLSIPALLGAGLQDYPERTTTRTPAMRKLSLSQ